MTVPSARSLKQKLIADDYNHQLLGCLTFMEMNFYFPGFSVQMKILHAVVTPQFCGAITISQGDCILSSVFSA
jgi:hypothetical protein